MAYSDSKSSNSLVPKRRTHKNSKYKLQNQVFKNWIKIELWPNFRPVQATKDKLTSSSSGHGHLSLDLSLTATSFLLTVISFLLLRCQHLHQLCGSILSRPAEALLLPALHQVRLPGVLYSSVVEAKLTEGCRESPVNVKSVTN